MRVKKLWILVTLLIIASFVLAACQPAATEAPTEEPAAPTDAPEEPEEPEETEEPMGEAVELRMTWYTDGNEDVVMRDLLDRFEAENSDIKVVMDNVAYQQILENLPIQLAAGEGPDMARVTDLGGLSQYYLDLSPYLSDPAYWEENFGSTLSWLRPTGDEDGIYGFQTQLTITGPFINRTLFEQAGVDVPSDSSDEVTWEEWAAAAVEVAEALDIDFPMAMDRSGHRLAGPAISQGAKYFDENGYPMIAGDPGFRDMAELFVGWHEDGVMPMEIWAGATGYVGANEEFGNAQVVLYMSGSWQVAQFTEQIGDAFDWEAVPNPCGPGACTAMPGGAALVAIGTTEHPEEVARVMEYLNSEEVLSEFSARTLFIPAHLGLSEVGVPFETDLAQAKKSLDVFVAQVGKLSPIAIDLQAYPYNRIVFDASRDRLTQVMVGELELDEAITRIQEDIDQGLAEEGIEKPETEVGEGPAAGELGSEDNPIKVLFVPSVDVDFMIESGALIEQGLNEATGLYYEVSVPTSYAATIEEMCASPDDTIGFIPAMGYVLANQLCGVEPALASERYGWNVYWTQFIVARDSEFQTLEDLDGASWGFGEVTSTSGYLYPTALFDEMGIAPGDQVETGGHPESVKAVYNGEVDFGTTYFSAPLLPEGTWSTDMSPDIPDEFLSECAVNEDGALYCGEYRVLDARATITEEAPDVVQKVRILGLTPEIPNDTLSFSPDFPEELKELIKEGIRAFIGTELCEQSLCHEKFYDWTGAGPIFDENFDGIRILMEAQGINLENIGE